MSKTLLPISQSQLEFSRIGNLGQAQNVSVSRHEDIIYELKQYKFPLTDAEFDSEFGETIPVFAQNQEPECPGRQISPLLLDGGFEVDDFFWLTGISLAAFGEPKSFTINGGIINGVPPVVVPCFDGCPPAEGGPATQASLYWGGPTWQFLYNFLNAYRFRWLIKRYEFVNVSASALGITHMGPAFVGAGSSQVPAMPYIQAVNAALHSKGVDDIRFIPQNTAGESLECVGAPTADVVYGAPELNGSMGRPFCLTNPMLLAPGMHLKMAFERADGDCCYYDAMRRNSTIGVDPFPYEEATSDTCEAGAFTIPGGCVTLGVILQGYVMNDDACWEALTRNQAFVAGSPMHTILKGNAAVTNLIQRRSGGNIRNLGLSEDLQKSLKGLTEATGG